MARLAQPLNGHEYHRKTVSELLYVARDAHEAARNLRGEAAEGRYLDQVNDACTVLYYRAQLQERAELANS